MIAPRRVRTTTAGTPAGGNVSFGMRTVIEWEDPGTGDRYSRRWEAEAAIARRTGEPYLRVERTAIGDFVIVDIDGRMVGDERFLTRSSATRTARVLLASGGRS